MNVILITGPTGIGKSKLVNLLEKEIDCIVINADAMQIYSSFSILTARPKLKDNYYLYGHVKDDEVYSVGHWLKSVDGLLEEICEKFSHKNLIFVGGTGLYFSSLLKGLSNIPDIELGVKKLSKKIYESQGLTSFLNDLESFDKETFLKIDQKNHRRVIRAWEVLEGTGRPLSYWQKEKSPPLIQSNESQKIILIEKKDNLDRIISERFKGMINDGAVEECILAKKNGINSASGSFKAIGVSEILNFLNGSISLLEAETKAIARTRQYAKRQMTWFRNNFQDWINYSLKQQDHSQIAEKIILKIRKV